MSKILELLNAERQRLVNAKATEEAAKRLRFNADKEALMGAFNFIKPLSQEGFVVTMHENPAHSPCPAIHVRGQHTIEIYLNEGYYRMGYCNSHQRTAIKTDELEALATQLTARLLRGE